MPDSTPTIRIDIVSDIVCPWCIVGYKRLEKALELVQDKVNAEVHWHPFILNAHLGEEGVNYIEHLMNKYGRTREQNQTARQHLIEAGSALGFEFDYYDEMKTYNTFQAHQLLRYTRETFGIEKEQALKLRLMTAFFAERKPIGEREVLIAEAVAIDLDSKTCEAILNDARYADAVKQELAEWSSMGINSVPTYIFNQQQALPGAHEPETMAEVIMQIAGV